MKYSLYLFLAAGLTVLGISCQKESEQQVLNSQSASTIQFTMPSEDEPHEGTWLQWPHNNTYSNHVSRMEGTFVSMVQALHTGERVHIIVYDQGHEGHVSNLLSNAGVNMTQIDFVIHPTNDMWARDSGPIFVRDTTGNLLIEDWGFNGWGDKVEAAYDDQVPTAAAQLANHSVINVPMINEGGSVEIDGHGTLMAKRSSILNNNRNPGMTQPQAEEIFNRYLGVTNFIWMDGYPGGDITDDHIDGTARFIHNNTIVMNEQSAMDPSEYATISAAKNAQGSPYTIVEIPLSQNNLPGTNYPGIYVNFYVGNTVVLVPNFNDPNDQVVNGIIQNLYPNKTVVGIEAIELGIDGGGIHCVTQQQPL